MYFHAVAYHSNQFDSVFVQSLLPLHTQTHNMLYGGLQKRQHTKY